MQAMGNAKPFKAMKKFAELVEAKSKGDVTPSTFS